MAKNNKQEPSIREQLNAVIALLVVLVGENGRKELLKQRRAKKDIVDYFHGLGLLNKDLAEIFNTGENSISNLKTKKQGKAKKKGKRRSKHGKQKNKNQKG